MASKPTTAAMEEKEEEEAASFAMALSFGILPPMVLTTVVQLDVLEIIKQAGDGAHLSPAEIAAKLPTNNPDAAGLLDRMLALLASYDIVSCTTRALPTGRLERLYGLAPVCQFLTQTHHGAALKSSVLLNHDPIMVDNWLHLKDVLSGETLMEKTKGMYFDNYRATDERFDKVFNTAMADASKMVVKKLVEIYKGFENISTLVDVGGATGMTLHTIVSKYPKIKGINFDLPHVIKAAPAYEGVEHVAGDMFVSVPKGDAIFLKWTLGDWEDDLCCKILKNCYDALPDNGKVIVCEYILPEVPNSNNASRMVFSLNVTRAALIGGKERTEEEYKAIAQQAGFKNCKVACSVYDFKIMEFTKNG